MRIATARKHHTGTKHLSTVPLSDFSFLLYIYFLLHAWTIQKESMSYLAHKVEAEMVLDISPQAFWKILNHLTLVNSSCGSPPLTLILPNSLLVDLRQLLPLHPPFYVSHPQMHRLLLWCSCMQEHLNVNNNFICHILHNISILYISEFNCYQFKVQNTEHNSTSLQKKLKW